jgi:hypothetical protein
VLDALKARRARGEWRFELRADTGLPVPVIDEVLAGLVRRGEVELVSNSQGWIRWTHKDHADSARRHAEESSRRWETGAGPRAKGRRQEFEP